MNKKIAIYGWYGLNNAGDELILATLLNKLRRIGHNDITVLSHNPAATSALHLVTTAPQFWMQPALAISAIRNADLLIIGGGGLLKDEGKKYPLLLLTVLAAKIFQTKVMLCGVGVGPLYTSIGRAVTKTLVHLADSITLRDEESLELLRTIGVTKKLNVTADIVPSFREQDPAAGARLLERSGITRDEKHILVGISLRPWYHVSRLWPDGKRRFSAFLDQVAQVLLELTCMRKLSFIFLPFQYEQDLPVAKQLHSLINDQQSFLAMCDRALTFRETADVIPNLDLLIGMRLHSMILASLGYVPGVALSYSSKVSSFMKQIDAEDRTVSVDDITADTLTEVIIKTLDQRREISNDLRTCMVSIKQASVRNFEFVEAILND